MQTVTTTLKITLITKRPSVVFSSYDSLDLWPCFVAFIPNKIMASPANLVKAPQDWLIQQICNWIAHPINNAHIREAMSSRGGWEAWLQLELLFELRALVIAFDISNTVDRERSPIWPDSPKDRIDFWFTWNALDANQELRQHWRLELKRRSKAESHDSFNERVFGGIGKCN